MFTNALGGVLRVSKWRPRVLASAVQRLVQTVPGFPVVTIVESVRGAVPVLPRARFPGPLAAPGVRVSTHRALHGSCRQAGLGIGQGVGILLPR